jgi:hypothetical protein
MKLRGLLGLVGTVIVAASCSGDDRPQVIDEPGGGRPSGRAGSSSAGGKNQSGGGAQNQSGGDGGQGGSSLEGLEVRITSPAPASDPNEDEVLVAEEVTVLCTVEAPANSGVAVDGSSVKIEVLDANGDVALGQDEKPLESVGAPTGNKDEYSARFVVTGVPTGKVSFRCAASSVDDAAAGVDEVSTLLDHGPTIVVEGPAPDSPHPLRGVMPVEFKVTPTPLSDSDEGAEIISVELSVAGAQIAAPVLVQDDDDPSLYRAEVDFTDPVLFKEAPPEHTSVHIEAVNARKPKAAKAVTDYAIVVDGTGPTIEYLDPKQNATVHGETVVKFKVVDSGAGVDVDTLELSLTGIETPFKYDASKPSIWSKTGDTFFFRFDSLNPQLADVAYQINVNVRARDRAGNLTDGKTLVLNKDDFAPTIDLDPGFARAKDSQGRCSVRFDPLYNALNDLAAVSESSNLIRALVYDRTNTGSGASVVYMSGTDRGSVRLYFQPDSSQPLLKDTDGDGMCDALAKDNFEYVSLMPLSRTGGEAFGTDGTSSPPTAGVCTVPTTATPAPPTLCNMSSDMRAVVQHNIDTEGSDQKEEPVVYAFTPSPGFECTGKKLDLTGYTADTSKGLKVSLSPDGWFCMAVTAKDGRGNQGVSPPLRICLDDPNVEWPGDGLPPCMKDKKDYPPSCVDSCTPPPGMPDHIYRF